MQHQPTEVKAEVIQQQPMGQQREVAVQQPQGADSFALMPNQHQIAQYSEYLSNFNAFLDSNLTEGVDYGKIPGVAKPSLLKPGAEKLEKLLSLRHEKILVEKVIEPGYSFVKYSYKTVVYNKRNEIVATCEGSCNSHEKKYRYQTVFANQATEEQKKNGKLETRKSKEGKPYDVYVVEKREFYDTENTIMKMAQKRSMVGAMLEATNSSGRFTQDEEDMSQEDLGRSAKPQPAPANTAYAATHPPAAATKAAQATEPRYEPVSASTGEMCEKCNIPKKLSKAKKWYCPNICWDTNKQAN